MTGRVKRFWKQLCREHRVPRQQPQSIRPISPDDDRYWKVFRHQHPKYYAKGSQHD